MVCEAVEAKLRAAVKTGRIPAQGDERIAAALKQRVITTAELDLMGEMKSLRRSVIMVDDFPPDFGPEPGGGAASTPDAAQAQADACTASA
jgi:acyl-CoA dehydrogenase